MVTVNNSRRFVARNELGDTSIKTISVKLSNRPSSRVVPALSIVKSQAMMLTLVHRVGAFFHLRDHLRSIRDRERRMTPRPGELAQH
jgi:hypothetical protein